MLVSLSSGRILVSILPSGTDPHPGFTRLRHHTNGPTSVGSIQPDAEETKEKRLREAIGLLAAGKKLGLK